MKLEPKKDHAGALGVYHSSDNHDTLSTRCTVQLRMVAAMEMSFMSVEFRYLRCDTKELGVDVFVDQQDSPFLVLRSSWSAQDRSGTKTI
jgi:hypothetical protein